MHADDPIFQLEAALAGDRIRDAQGLVVDVALGLDLVPAYAACVRWAADPDEGVRGNSILGFGHLARRFGSLPSVEARALIERALNDPSDYVRGHAQSAADDTARYLGWTYPLLEERRTASREERIRLVRQLVACVQVRQVADELRKHPWDCDEPLVALERRDVIAVLQRFLANDMGPNDVGEWADELEVRDDVGTEQDVQNVLVELSMSGIDGEVTPARAREIIAALQK